MDTGGLVICFAAGFVTACFGIMALGSLLQDGGKSRQAEEQVEQSTMSGAPAAVPSDITLREANIDAARLAGALESGLRSGWPFNYLVTRALAQHYARIGRTEVERSPRLN